ncbi:hypothetical protein M404DRAFT_379915 [Pisolithus tinctorius Marx 270]|uniref:Uncharacterized protein n=1 Tax=Pisolithus tinctorius Marx 270 TaxID=870435 RepID=A0A0C3NGF6_PISTI|nr:hypothetical protein M404DRAFT_379915 [Pisolithus tinctorius Marx 270]
MILWPSITIQLKQANQSPSSSLHLGALVDPDRLDLDLRLRLILLWKILCFHSYLDRPMHLNARVLSWNAATPTPVHTNVERKNSEW